jgi:hypothetical protein
LIRNIVSHASSVKLQERDERGDTRIVDENRHGTKRLAQPGRGRFDLLAIRDVTAERDRPAPGPLDARHGRRGTLLGQIENPDRDAIAGKALCDRAADAGCGAGHQGYSIGHIGCS